ncbi:MAG: flagellar basal body rod protein FlgC [Dorea sp.]|uniref:flagellar basal body rod protein FlgC n=1 Tax=Sporofaciens musculi TaxID=2681861 RepID=UPI0021704F00|nr:flagellar basal body rod protein FlgC [Sporofaciens musculi]MCI9423167.1 flagellar basal body rod protein FlgC [Dorea sp.]
MSFLNSFDISASGMTAERQRLDIAAENISNAETTRTASGGTYRRKMVVLQEVPTTSFRTKFNSLLNRTASKGGVKVTEIVEDQRDLNPVYNPDHPDANEEGYVMMPNVDLVKETIDGMSATRAYEANITAFNAMKLMAQKALDIGK